MSKPTPSHSSEPSMNLQRDLVRAVIDKDLARVRHLVEECGADPSTARYVSHSSETPLHAASSVAWRHFEIAKYLVEDRLVPVNTIHRKFGVTPLHWAVVGGDLKMAKLVAEGVGGDDALRARDNRGLTPLHMACEDACEDGCLDVIRYLIEQRGADVSAKSPRHGSVLRFALQSVDSGIARDVLAYLLPRCPVDHDALVDLWNPPPPKAEISPSWEIKEMTLRSFVEGRLSANREDTFSFGKYPLQGVFHCPLLKEKNYNECISRYSSREHVASTLDDRGQLPLHVAIHASKVTKEVTSAVLLSVLKLERRASTARDPISGFFPFEAIAFQQIVDEFTGTLKTQHGDAGDPGAVSAVLDRASGDSDLVMSDLNTSTATPNAEDDWSVSESSSDDSSALDTDDMSIDSCEPEKVDPETSGLDLLYQLFRCDPVVMLTTRGVALSSQERV